MVEWSDVGVVFSGLSLIGS